MRFDKDQVRAAIVNCQASVERAINADATTLDKWTSRIVGCKVSGMSREGMLLFIIPDIVERSFAHLTSGQTADLRMVQYGAKGKGRTEPVCAESLEMLMANGSLNRALINRQSHAPCALAPSAAELDLQDAEAYAELPNDEEPADWRNFTKEDADKLDKKIMGIEDPTDRGHDGALT